MESDNSSNLTLVSDTVTEPINQVNMKIPAYFDNTELWIRQVEAVFKSSRPKVVSEKAKYYLLISQLPGHVLSIVSDKMQPEGDNPYTVLVAAMLERLSAPEPDIIKALKTTKLGDRRPYTLLTEIRNYCKRLNVTSEEFQRALFLDALPENVRSILEPMKNSLDCDQISQTADRLIASQKQNLISTVESTTPTGLSFPITNDTTHKSHHVTISELRQEMKDEIAGLTEQVKAMSLQRYRPTNNTKSRGSLCYYHKKFGRNAFKCEQPCTWENRNSNRRNVRSYQRNTYSEN